MTIPPQATQEELEKILRADLRHGIRMMLLAGVLLSPFCYLRCLLNPLWVLGLKVPGIFVTAIFGCYVGWQYVNNNPAAGETALLWWAVWAGIMLLIHYVFYALTPVTLCRASKKYQSPLPGENTGSPTPQEHPLNFHKNSEGYPETEFYLSVPQRGLYALRWEITDYEGELKSTAVPCAISHHHSGSPNTLTELYRLEAGTHRLKLQLMNRDAPPPTKATLTQLNG